MMSDFYRNNEPIGEVEADTLFYAYKQENFIECTEDNAAIFDFADHKHLFRQVEEPEEMKD